jgi:hypothetical protein
VRPVHDMPALDAPVPAWPGAGRGAAQVQGRPGPEARRGEGARALHGGHGPPLRSPREGVEEKEWSGRQASEKEWRRRSGAAARRQRRSGREGTAAMRPLHGHHGPPLRSPREGVEEKEWSGRQASEKEWRRRSGAAARRQRRSGGEGVERPPGVREGVEEKGRPPCALSMAVMDRP